MPPVARLRSFSGRVGDPAFWNSKIRAPHCFNPPAARTVLPGVLKSVDWILRGVTPTEVPARTARAYASGELKAPAPGAMAYMLSPKQYLGDADPHWMPHPMFYYDRSTPAATLGAGGLSSPLIDGTAGDEQSPFVLVLIPVRQWSDGTPALSKTGH